MIDRLFSLALTFCVLAGGTVAIGSELLSPRQDAVPHNSVAQLPRVVVTGKKTPVATEVARADASEGVAKFVQ